MRNELKALYTLKFASIIVYMLQSTEYKVSDYLRWFWRVERFSKVTYRRQLVKTKVAKLLLTGLYIGIVLNWLVIIYLIVFGLTHHHYFYIPVAIILRVAVPVIWGHVVVVPLLVGRILVMPRNSRRIGIAAATFKKHPATTIAIAGSYGKTSVKEILTTVLSVDKKVAATKGNQNVPISHSRFAERLDGDEDVLIIEFGEGAPGDVAKFSKNVSPDIGIITGLAPAHLDRYKTLDAAAKDIFSLADYLGGNDVYVNTESEPMAKYLHPQYHTYNSGGVLGWKVTDIKNTLQGLSFVMQKGPLKINLKTKLLGKHLVGPVALASALAHKLGIELTKIEKASNLLKPYEHRMQPYKRADAWIIDDTYNGNIEGIRAGLELLKELPAKRKIYVTPGLVDQGPETEDVHIKIGELIAAAAPNKVVLIKHSVTKYIQDGLAKYGYKGELIIEEKPLEFYSNLDQLVAAGDLVLMQNDWTDNYN